MRGTLFVLTLIAANSLAATPSYAQRGRSGSGKVFTADGLAYDINSTEWRMAGNNPVVYQQIMAQKAMIQQQKLLLKQQRQMQAQLKAQQKAFERWVKEHPEEYLQWQAQQQAPFLQARRSRGRR